MLQRHDTIAAFSHLPYSKDGVVFPNFLVTLQLQNLRMCERFNRRSYMVFLVYKSGSQHWGLCVRSVDHIAEIRRRLKHTITTWSTHHCYMLYQSICRQLEFFYWPLFIAHLSLASKNLGSVEVIIIIVDTVSVFDLKEPPRTTCTLAVTTLPASLLGVNVLKVRWDFTRPCNVVITIYTVEWPCWVLETIRTSATLQQSNREHGRHDRMYHTCRCRNLGGWTPDI